MLAATRKSETKLRKAEENMEKENNTDESDFSENEMPDLSSLNPFEFEQETNIGEINSSCIDDKEEDTEYKVKRIGNSEWCECSKHCKPMKAYTESLCCQERNNTPERCF